MTLKKNTTRNQEFTLSRFQSQFSNRELESITSDEILSFLTQLTEGTKQTTKEAEVVSIPQNVAGRIMKYIMAFI
jgi:site-specific recombinase XerD